MAFFSLSAACQSLTSIDVEYRDCFAPRAPYVVQFDQSLKALEQSCWRSEDAGPGRTISASDGDLLIGFDSTPPVSVGWADDAPALVRRVAGDFILVTHVEATERLNSSFCLLEGDSAGIVVRGTPGSEQPDVRAGWTLHPDPAQAQNDCDDDAEIGAILEANATSASDGTATGPVGATGEADIAMCRSGSQLVYFFRDPEDEDAPWSEKDWRAVELVEGDATTTRVDEVGTGPLDIGLMTTAGSGEGTRQVQGAFNWVAVLADGSIGSDCRGPLEAMQAPEND